jgi:hypothetical protein
LSLRGARVSFHTMRGRSRRPWHLPAFALAVVTSTTHASATDTTTTPFAGITWLHRNVAGSLNLHAVTVDLCATGIQVRATAPSEKQRTVSSFGQLVSAEVAVNGDFFTFATYQTTGLAIGSGIKWPGTHNDGFQSSIGFGKDRAEVYAPAAATNPGAWVTELVSSRPLILSGGVVKRGFTTAVCAGPVTAAGDCAKDPRTGIGLSQDKRTLYLVVVDGRQPGLSDGLTTFDLATTMKTLGAWDAINMDSGGSAQMWIKGKGIVNNPSDGTERVVANHLAVIGGGTGAPTSCTPLPSSATDAGPDAAVPAEAPAPPLSDAGASSNYGPPSAGSPSVASTTGDASGCTVSRRRSIDLGLGAVLVLAAAILRRRLTAPTVR